MAADSSPILIVGGGLTGSLTALALMKWRPDTSFVMIDRAPRFGGGPVLPFFLGAVPLANGALIDPLIVRSWTGYHVAGPGFNLMAGGRTAYLVPEQIHAEILQTLPPERYLLGREVVGIDADGVSLADGWRLGGSVVLDMRGDAVRSQAGTAWRQTTSRRLRFAAPHGLDRPILADATFPGSEWTFLQYCPLDPHALLVQYVGYSHDPALRPIDRGALESEGGQLFDETVLIERLLGDPGSAPARGGAAAIVAHASLAEMWNPILSSSVAGATRIAKAVATAPDLSAAALGAAIEALSVRASDYRRQCAALIERLCGGDPGGRAAALGTLYSLGQDAVGRFETSDASAGDLARLDGGITL